MIEIFCKFIDDMYVFVIKIFEMFVIIFFKFISEGYLLKVL